MKDFMSEMPRGFKGIWIPQEIWCDQRLTPFDKFLFGELHSLDSDEGCYASNEYLCKVMQEKERKLQDSLAKLKSIGYIWIESFDGRKRIIRTTLTPEKDKSLFSTSDPQNPENDKSVKSLFSTSRVQDFAPLPLEDIHTLEQSLEKTTTSKAAASSKPTAKQQKKTPIPDCLKEIDIPIDKKQYLSDHFDTPTIEHSIRWATHPLTKIKQSLEQALIWACQKNPIIPVSEDEIKKEKEKTQHAIIEKNRAYAEEKFALTQLHPEDYFKIKQDVVEIGTYGTGKFYIVAFVENGFCDQLDSIMRKLKKFPNGKINSLFGKNNDPNSN